MPSQLSLVAPIVLCAAISCAQPVSFIARAEATPDNKFRNMVMIFACSLGGGFILNILIFIAVHCHAKKQTAADHVNDDTIIFTANEDNISNSYAASNNTVPKTNGSNTSAASGYSAPIANSTNSSAARRGFAVRQQLPDDTPIYLDLDDDPVFKIRQEIEELAEISESLGQSTNEIGKIISKDINAYIHQRTNVGFDQLFNTAMQNIAKVAENYNTSIIICDRCIEYSNKVTKHLGAKEIHIEASIATCMHFNKYIKRKLDRANLVSDELDKLKQKIDKL